MKRLFGSTKSVPKDNKIVRTFVEKDFKVKGYSNGMQLVQVR